MQILARAGGWHLHVVPASNESELYTAFDSLVRLKAEGILLGTDALFNTTYKQVAALASIQRSLSDMSKLAQPCCMLAAWERVRQPQDWSSD